MAVVKGLFYYVYRSPSNGGLSYDMAFCELDSKGPVWYAQLSPIKRRIIDVASVFREDEAVAVVFNLMELCLQTTQWGVVHGYTDGVFA